MYIQGWKKADLDTILDAETAFFCCGFENQNPLDPKNRSANALGGYMCDKVPSCVDSKGGILCITCKEQVQDKINAAFNSVGGLGLFFAFTEVGGGRTGHKV